MDQHSEPQPAGERRRHPHLRAIYREARIHIDHLFHNRHDWADSSIDYLAQRAVHETYPHLHGDEILILVSAIERLHRALVEQEARALQPRFDPLRILGIRPAQ